MYGGIGAFWRLGWFCIAGLADLVISFRLGSLGLAQYCFGVCGFDGWWVCVLTADGRVGAALRFPVVVSGLGYVGWCFMF